MNSKENKKKIYILNALIVIMLIFIWGHSMVPAVQSSEESGYWATYLIPILKMFVGEKLATEYLVRKLAHFSEYAVFGFIVSLRVRQSQKLDIKLIGKAEGASFLTAFLDESIQVLSGRGPMITDVWIDSFGAFTGILLCSLIVFVAERRKHARRTS